jgi:1-acyl-sn-glycerol-3-phosphate acyltransferase
MDASRALRRLTGFAARDALPAIRLGADGVRLVLDEVVMRVVGRDVEDRLRRVHMPMAEGEVDPFGLDPEWAKYAVAVATFFHRIYFRAEVFGAEHVPPGRVLLVSNHSGQVPFDALVIAASLFLENEPPRIVRSMVEKWTQTLPFVSTTFARLGQVVGVPENARHLLELGEALLVFPEGSRGISKSYAERYRLTDFGLGFMRLALETGTPIVPIGVIGAEEQYVSFGNLTSAAKLLGMPSFPLIPQWLIPGGQLPLPTRYRLYFGEPMMFDGDPDDDDSVIEEKVHAVRDAVASLVENGLKRRRSIFW